MSAPWRRVTLREPRSFSTVVWPNSPRRTAALGMVGSPPGRGSKFAGRLNRVRRALPSCLMRLGGHHPAPVHNDEKGTQIVRTLDGDRWRFDQDFRGTSAPHRRALSRARSSGIASVPPCHMAGPSPRRGICGQFAPLGRISEVSEIWRTAWRTPWRTWCTS